MKTMVISAFPGTGKSYAFKNCSNSFKISDSDSSQFSWIEEERGRIRNPDFPDNYIQHIKNNIGKYDVIFVSSHLEVRQALNDAGIEYFTIYPQANLLEEYKERYIQRGNDEHFIDFIVNNWSEMMKNISHEPHGFGLLRLESGQYIGDLLSLYDGFKCILDQL